MRLVICLLLTLALAPAVHAAETRVAHGMSLTGELKYPPDFKHFDYVNPDAPKGGEIRLGAFGTYDSFNPFVIKGRPAAGIGLMFETLMTTSGDEASSEYGLLARSVEVPEDLSWVAYTLREGARWHDGKPIMPEDVVFSFDILKTKGAPLYRHYYANVDKAEVTGPRTVKFFFSGPKNRELPQIVSQLFVLPKHYWEGRDFEATTLEPPVGSGPYKIDGFEAGRWISYKRDETHWARDLPVSKGRYNFDVIRYDYYREDQIAFEAFKAHQIDFRMESTAKRWATGYDFPAIRDGRAIKETIDHERPTGMQAFIFNLRREKFRDRRLRQALGYAMDFEWSNRNLFYDQYTRTKSYFANSELASSGLPSADELKLLEPLRGRIPDDVFTEAYDPPATDGSGNMRGQLRLAIRLLKDAGYEIKDGKLLDPATGAPFTMEFLLVQPSFQRIVGPIIENLKRLGVAATVRVVDSSQYQRRSETFDFDIIAGGWGQSLSPGNEQRDFWGSEAAKREGSRNFIGIQDEAIDILIDKVIYASDRAALVTATRALDRVLLWGHYVIPNWHSRNFRIAYWNRFDRPAIRPKYLIGFHDTWWVDPAKNAALKAKRAKQ